MACISCGRGFLNECECEDKDTPVITITDSPGRPRKADDEIGVSAGRKRAAADYEIKENMPCEWRFMANCGGGPLPIVGCLTGVQQNRHHGPDKNTARNEEGNVHRICAKCHNTWHGKNNREYGPDKSKFAHLLHDPRPMTEKEIYTHPQYAEMTGRLVNATESISSGLIEHID